LHQSRKVTMAPTTQKEVFQIGTADKKSFTTEIKEVPVPTPKDDEVLIKVVVAGTNPKDWKVPMHIPGVPIDEGDDIAGIIESVGKDVTEFKAGDRVAAFHVMLQPHGAFSYFAISPAHTAFHIPNKTSFEEAATLPLAYMTAAIGLYHRMELPLPWNAPSETKIPIIIYGGSSAVGAFALKLIKLNKTFSPVVVVAGAGSKYVETLIDPAVDKIIDYRSGDVVAKLREALGGKKVYYCYDAVSDHKSYIYASEVLEDGGKIATVLPGKDYTGLREGVLNKDTQVGTSHKQDELVGSTEFAHALFRFLSRGLEKGFYSGHPYEIVPGGLEGVEQGLRNLEAGKASAIKYVYRVADTPGYNV